MKRVSSRRAGFTLIELMIASAIAVIVLVGGMSVGVALQRRATFEEQKMHAQGAMRSVQDYFINELVRAGTPFGNARIYTGHMGDEYRFGVRVVTNRNDWGGQFAAPAAPYAGMISDYVEILGQDPASQTVIPLASCVAPVPFIARDANTVCLASNGEAGWQGQLVVFSDANTGMGCLARVTTVTGARLTISMGVNGAEPSNPTDPCRPGGALWLSSDATAARVRATGFRVNWFGGNNVPVLEMTTDAYAATPGWDPVSREVERLKVRLGVTDSIALPVNLVWFPQDGASPRVPMDRCAPPTADASCVVPNGALIYDTTANFNTFEQLMRRVRAVELSVRTRSPRQDRDLIQRQGAGFRLDPDQLPLDGFTRRTTIFQNMPRNFSLAGNFVTP